MNEKEYETHVRSNESIRDHMDGVMPEPNKQMSRENDNEHKSNCGHCNCDNTMSRG